jgi:hypothetical protein
MAYNHVNKLLTYQKVIEIVNENYEEGYTTYAAVWRKHVNPVYPMSYQKFIQIINYPNIDKAIKAECERVGKDVPGKKVEDKRQLKLFNIEDYE